MKLDPESILKNIKIPPRPTILVDLMEEQRKEDPDVKKLANLIGRDVGLSAALIKTVNSPFYGLRSKTSSAQEAIHFLGIKNVMNLISGFALKSAIGNAPRSVERFWSMTESVALVSAYIASTLPGIPKDEAYTFGLFHNCGMPLLDARFPEYEALTANCRNRITDVEDERLLTNHATVGYLLTKSWNLSEEICEAAQRHHDPSVFTERNCSAKTPTLVAIAMLANNAYRTFHEIAAEGGWEEDGPFALDHLGFSELEYEDLREGAHQKLAEAG